MIVNDQNTHWRWPQLPPQFALLHRITGPPENFGIAFGAAGLGIRAANAVRFN